MEEEINNPDQVYSLEQQLAFYMTITAYLLDKYCDSHVTIAEDEWRTLEGEVGMIKIRLNNNNEVEVMHVKDGH